ncbi:alcohol dehydrogenase catalytic domain-containing protein [Alkalihalobacillus sp. MEB130]|uniref:alcohol dehydrogenase catalytic domain-containing protein n=1 Tax=Alkalihalobacillus sp. MEB130 TaxID=2976704 RepID=UPI0028E00FA3|nr:alcohol dehydrogenase catalytic domain-containing protein [Alkalihalobacillus sp. MEB130]MDT8860348.1 alcohol dehydrogenase catalytic domain-containing protein [Alkalihalobacillus sp. MEB130]
MKTLVWTGPNTMKVEETERPSIQTDEVLIQVEAVGICGSEIEGFLGHNSLRIPPLVMGHEFCGRVVEVGEEVETLTAGRKVTVNPLINCGVCDRCRKGTENLCDNRQIIGINRSGAFAEYVAVPASAVHVISETLDPFTASLAEPLACCLRAARRAMAIQPFANVLIYGAGTIGLLSGFVSQILGANKVIMVDINDERLKTVQGSGIDYVINSKTEDVEGKLKKIVGEKGIDIIIDAAGFLPTRTQAMQLVNSGGVIMNVGLGIDETPIPVNQQIRSETTLLGSFCYTKQDFYDAVQLLEEGKISHEGWSEVRPLEEGQEAFTDLVNGEVINSKIFLSLK